MPLERRTRRINESVNIARKRRKSGVSTLSHSIGIGGRSKRPKKKAGGDDLDEVDRILDKIREQGMDALNSRERAFLDTMSRKYRSGPDTTA